MTIEDFTHRCLLIKAGNTTLSVPCCANCKHYIKNKIYNDFYCTHPETVIDDFDNPSNVLIAMEPEDFCSRFEEGNN